MAKSKGNSVRLTASGVVTTANKAGILKGYNLIGGTTGSGVSFKNGGASGTTLWQGTCIAGTAVGDVSKSEHFMEGIIFSTDIYAIIVGTGAILYVHYDEIQD